MEKKSTSKDKGKGKQIPRGSKKRKFSLRTGGDFKIREGISQMSESESDSDSERIPSQPPGETSRMVSLDEMDMLINKHLDAFLEKLKSESLHPSAPKSVPSFSDKAPASPPTVFTEAMPGESVPEPAQSDFTEPNAHSSQRRSDEQPLESFSLVP